MGGLLKPCCVLNTPHKASFLNAAYIGKRVQWAREGLRTSHVVRSEIKGGENA